MVGDMNNSKHANSYQELHVYQKAFTLSEMIFETTKKFPREETFSLTDQLRRSSRSIGAQIAEAWAKRRYEKHFVSKLTDADAEQMESQHWMQVAFSCGYIDEKTLEKTLNELKSIGRMLHTIMKKSNSFCNATS
jgi:four helix bundle protein